MKKLRIASTTTDNDLFQKKCFEKMANLKELHLLNNPDLINLFENNSTIEKVTFEYGNFNFDEAVKLLNILETFENLRCIYMKFSSAFHINVILAFENHFIGREVELIFLANLFIFNDH